MARLGVLAGSSSVLAEKIVFGVLPPGLSSGLRQRVRGAVDALRPRREPMIHGGSVETAPALHGDAAGIRRPRA